MSKTYTKGNVVVEDIKIGDIHYEYEYGTGIRVEVISLPVKEGDQWTWQSKQVSTGEIINYLITEGFEHYGPNLYDYEAYQVNVML